MWPRKPSGESSNKLDLPEIFLNSLEALEGATIVIAPGDVPIFASSDAEKIGILREGKIVSEELLATIRVVRRTNTKQNGKIEIARGPIGEGKHELMVNVIPLVEGNLVLVLLRDESEADRIHEVRRDFVANISHELKTPIGALSLLSEAVLGAKDDPQSVSKFAARMQSEAKRLTDLVQEIISLSRVQDSDPLRVPEILDVKEMIFEAIDQCKTSAEARKIQIVFSGDATEKVLGDRLQLIMAIHNLIENAINYSPESTNVSITATTEDSIIDISVSDQGIGIPQTEVERIFERFYRVDPARSRQTGGTGLGLSIVKHIVTNHGGDIKVWSVENVGSTFSIRLPVMKDGESVS